MFDLSNKLGLCMGILEGSDIPDIFGDSIAAMCAWKQSYYTLNPSTGLIDTVVNLGGDAFTGISGHDIEVHTEADYTNWFNVTGTPNNSSSISWATADENIMDLDPSGIITLCSFRMKEAHALALTSDKAINNTDISFGRTLPHSESVVRTSCSTQNDSTSAKYDYFGYKWHTDGWSVTGNPFEFAGIPHGEVLNAYHDPSNHKHFVSGFDLGQDLVISWFYQATGLRCMINGVFVTLEDIYQHNGDGSYKAGGAAQEAAMLAGDHSPYAYSTRLGTTPGDGGLTATFALGWPYVDYQGVFSGSKSDAWIRSAHSLLLNNKPIS